MGSEAMYLFVMRMVVFLCPGYWQWPLNTSPSSCLICERWKQKYTVMFHLFSYCMCLLKTVSYCTIKPISSVYIQKLDRYMSNDQPAHFNEFCHLPSRRPSASSLQIWDIKSVQNENTFIKASNNRLRHTPKKVNTNNRSRGKRSRRQNIRLNYTKPI